MVEMMANIRSVRFAGLCKGCEEAVISANRPDAS